jgi:hypothetical protein
MKRGYPFSIASDFGSNRSRAKPLCSSIFARFPQAAYGSGHIVKPMPAAADRTSLYFGMDAKFTLANQHGRSGVWSALKAKERASQRRRRRIGLGSIWRCEEWLG